MKVNSKDTNKYPCAQHEGMWCVCGGGVQSTEYRHVIEVNGHFN